MQTNVPRVVIAGTGSGCGKTTVTCGILQALVNRGIPTAAAKCGPDYIDPMFHSTVIGTPSINLDSFFFTDNTLRYLLAEHGKDREITILEGVMGYFDGMDMVTGKASTFEIAAKTNSPVILVVGAKGASLSVLAAIHGFLTFMGESRICGVILNSCTAMTYAMLKEEILRRFSGRIQPLGYLPNLPECSLESRHLGLVTAQEVTDLHSKLDALADQAEKSLDLDGILKLAGQAEPLVYSPVDVYRAAEPVRIAVARDRAFCFYYEDNFRMLRTMGAELVPFSPLEDPCIPENVHGLYLGGGYPELYTEKLSRNESMLASVRDAVHSGLPCIAECGGFMYLNGSIGGTSMAGVLPGNCRDVGRLVRFGYVHLRAEKNNLLCHAGEEIPAHEFHHWDAEFPGEDFTAQKESGRNWRCAIASERLYAGFPHFHFYANPRFAENFYNACLEEKHHGRKH